MTNLLSLTKIGNLKLGVVKNGKPIQTSRILVTHPTKEGEENFKIYEGFNPEGEEKVNITLPFDSIDLNFEVNYVGFLTIDGKEYISKCPDIGEEILMYPLNVEDFDLDIISAGKLTEKKVEQYGMERVGFLKSMLKDVSGFGEVFYLKTKSINTIRAINDQLRILSALTGDRLAGIPLVLKPIKKDIDGKQVLYVSISFDEDILFDLGDIVAERNESPLDFKALEDLYINSRTPEKTVAISKIKKDLIKIEMDTETEIAQIEKEAEEANKEASEDEVAMTELLGEDFKCAVPNKTLVGLFRCYDEDSRQDFVDFVSDEEFTLSKCLQKITELSKTN